MARKRPVGPARLQAGPLVRRSVRRLDDSSGSSRMSHTDSCAVLASGRCLDGSAPGDSRGFSPGGRGAPHRGARNGAGRGLPAFRLPPRPRGGRLGVRPQRGPGRHDRGVRARRRPRRLPAADRGRSTPRGRRARSARGGDPGRRGARRLRDRGEPRRGRAPRVDPGRPRDVPGVPRRSQRPGRQAARLRPHELHALRPALHDRARRPVRPPRHHHGRLRSVRRMPARVRGPGRPPFPRAAGGVPGVRATARPARPIGRADRGRRPAARGGGRAARRPHRRGEGTGRLPPRVRRDVGRAPCAACARGSGATRSRSR